MHFISAVLFALSANMDNVPLGIAYGIRGIKISFARNLLIALITSIGTLVSMSFGTVITLFIKKETAAIIGCSILILMGLWFIAGFFRKRLKKKKTAQEEESQEVGDAKKSKQMTTRQSLGLALVLMVNNMAFGIGANIAGLPIILTSICTFLCSMLLLICGIKLGLKASSERLGTYSELISGILIVILGIYELFV